MPEGMAGDMGLPAKPPLLGVYVPEKVNGINGHFRIILFWEKPAGGPAGCDPVLYKDIQCIFGKDGIRVRAVFAVEDVDTRIRERLISS